MSIYGYCCWQFLCEQFIFVGFLALKCAPKGQIMPRPVLTTLHSHVMSNFVCAVIVTMPHVPCLCQEQVMLVLTEFLLLMIVAG